MLKTSWHQGQSLLIQAKSGLDPEMTVGELFQTGPMRLQVSTDSDLCAVLEVLLPEVLEVTRAAEDDDSRQCDLFGDDTHTFDRFLQEETVRVRLEASTIEDIQAARTRLDPGRTTLDTASEKVLDGSGD